MEGLVEFNITFFIQIINSLVLIGALTYILFKPVTKFLDDRKEKIQSSINEAEANKKEVSQLKAKYEEQLKDIRSERSAIIADATKKAEDRRTEIVEEAKEEAVKIKVKAKKDTEREKQQTMLELKDEISTLVIAAASKVIEKELDEATHHNMIQQFLDEAGETQWQN